MADYRTSELNTADAQTWTFNVDELDEFTLDAPNAAKSAVAKHEGIDYRDLRARLINNKQMGDTYVTVVKVF